MARDRLWAPWRLAYIKGDKASECIFCTKPELPDEESYVLHRGHRCFVILNAFPYTNGHLMVSPFDHVGALQLLDTGTLAEMMALTQLSMRLLDAAYSPDGYNVGLNQGKVAGAGFEKHIHLHVVPRWGGDTNFMPVVGDVRVMPQSLEESYRMLRPGFDERTSE